MELVKLILKIALKLLEITHRSAWKSTIGGLTTSDSENGIDVKFKLKKGIDQWNYSDVGNNQIFGNNTQINVNNHVGDLISGVSDTIHLESQVVRWVRITLREILIKNLEKIPRLK